MHIVCSDLEGVFVPEIWINVALKTGIEDLKLTTRDISDYDVLMRRRLSILATHQLKLQDITAVIAGMDPLEGALEFLDWLRPQTPIIVVSDTFTQFAGPLMKKLGWPTLFCHSLEVAPDGVITGYRQRQPDSKRRAEQSLRQLNFKVIGMGDSYNDINLLKEADTGILFRPPENVVREFPQFPVTRDYEELKPLIRDALAKD